MAAGTPGPSQHRHWALHFIGKDLKPPKSEGPRTKSQQMTESACDPSLPPSHPPRPSVDSGSRRLFC
jgi:hypothetical protein